MALVELQIAPTSVSLSRRSLFDGERRLPIEGREGMRPAGTGLARSLRGCSRYSRRTSRDVGNHAGATNRGDHGPPRCRDLGQSYGSACAFVCACRVSLCVCVCVCVAACASVVQQNRPESSGASRRISVRREGDKARRQPSARSARASWTSPRESRGKGRRGRERSPVRGTGAKRARKTELRRARAPLPPAAPAKVARARTRSSNRESSER